MIQFKYDEVDDTIKTAEEDIVLKIYYTAAGKSWNGVFKVRCINRQPFPDLTFTPGEMSSSLRKRCGIHDEDKINGILERAMYNQLPLYC
jgi:hypothetical protein